MGFCCVVGCSNRHGRNKYKEGVRFHSFPMDQTLRDRWIQAIRRVHWKPTYHSRVCTEHFSDDVVDRTYVSGLRLRVGAVPSIFPTHPGHLKKSLSYRKRMRFLKLWGVKDCDVVISGKEREIADAALPRWKEYEQRMGRLCLDVPLPIVDVKEVEPVQNRLLPPLIIDRDIIPFAVEGHDIEPSSILEHLKDKIRIKIEKNDSPPVGEHPYSSKPNQSSWPILQTPFISPVAPVGASSSPTTPAALTASTNPSLASTATQFTTQTLAPLSDLVISSYGSVASPPTYPPINIGKIDSPKQPVLKKVSNIPINAATLAPERTLKMVPNSTRTGSNVGSLMTFRLLSVGTQTNLPIKRANKIKKIKKKYRLKLKVLRQRLSRATNRLQKATNAVEEYKSVESLIVEQVNERENVIVVEAADKCDCFSKQKEHVDGRDTIGNAFNRHIPIPEERRAAVVENEKLMERVGIVSRKLKQKKITRVVVFQTEDLLPMF